MISSCALVLLLLLATTLQCTYAAPTEIYRSISYDYVIICQYDNGRLIECTLPPNDIAPQFMDYYPATSPQPPTPETTTPEVVPLFIPDDGGAQKPTDDQGIGCKAILSCLG